MVSSLPLAQELLEDWQYGRIVVQGVVGSVPAGGGDGGGHGGGGGAPVRPRDGVRAPAQRLRTVAAQGRRVVRAIVRVVVRRRSHGRHPRAAAAEELLLLKQLLLLRLLLTQSLRLVVVEVVVRLANGAVEARRLCGRKRCL